jgi:hypothetical protein
VMPPLEAAIRDTISYIVEKVLDMKINKSNSNKFGDWAFLTKWVGHVEPTWQEWSVMRQLDMTHEYLRSVRKVKYIPPKIYEPTAVTADEEDT